MKQRAQELNAEARRGPRSDLAKRAEIQIEVRDVRFSDEANLDEGLM